MRYFCVCGLLRSQNICESLRVSVKAFKAWELGALAIQDLGSSVSSLGPGFQLCSSWRYGLGRFGGGESQASLDALPQLNLEPSSMQHHGLLGSVSRLWAILLQTLGIQVEVNWESVLDFLGMCLEAARF